MKESEDAGKADKAVFRLRESSDSGVVGAGDKSGARVWGSQVVVASFRQCGTRGSHKGSSSLCVLPRWAKA